MELGTHDLVLTKDKGGNVTAAGFSLESTCAREGRPALLLKGGGRDASGFRLTGLAVPAGLGSILPNQTAKVPTEDGGVAPDSLVEQLLLLAQPPEKGRATKRRRPSGRGRRRKTRRA
jgi:hypothetical protein